MTRSLRRDQVFRLFTEEMLEVVRALSEESERRGFRLCLVGGPVRDLVLGRAVGDVDLLLEAPGFSKEGVADLAQEVLPDPVKVVGYGRFGTARVEVGSVKLDVALARRERYRAVGALPTVESATLEEDLFRRDFSVNALAIDLTSRSSGNRMALIDPTGGSEDLARGRLRVLHDQSFHDDPTRALRAARLGARLGFGLDRRTRSVLRRALEDEVFARVSGDRIRREIEKVFHDPLHGLDPVLALRRMDEWGLLKALDPGLVLPSAAVLPLRRFGKAVARPPWRSRRLRPWVAGLSIWFAELPPVVRQRVLGRLAVRGEATEQITGFSRFRKQKLAALSRARGRGAVDGLLAGTTEESLHALHAGADPAVRKQISRWAAEDRSETIPVTGSDLLKLGLEGAALGQVLARLRAGFLDGELMNREEALALAQELLRRRQARASREQKARPRPKADR
ncbi:MAG: hypothetical protein VX252_08285 [Myxococcota bacterium]|nr:hypothetical protein [Myxococcota bacterium]